VTVGVFRIRWFCGDPKARPDQQRGENIQHRFCPISNQRVSVTENPAREFHRREHGIQRDAAQHQLRASVCAALGGGMDKLLLLADSVPILVVAAPDFAWPSVIHNIGLTRTELVPVTPPRV